MKKEISDFTENPDKVGRVYWIFILFIFLALIFSAVAPFITSIGYNTRQSAALYKNVEECTNNTDDEICVILDPGHGGEDPGAAVGELKEKDINLAVSLKIKSFLDMSGIKVYMTRDDDRLLCNPNQTSGKKMSDLKNRLEFAEKYKNPVFISIHVNKFPIEKYFGPQVFYSENNVNSAVLASIIQKNTLYFSPGNKRKEKPENHTVYILEHIKCPAVLAEIGFLSNLQEAKLLSDNNYQNRIAFSVFKGISEYIDEIYNMQKS